MKIRRRLVMLFSALIVGAVGVTSLLTLRFVQSAAIGHEIEEMRSRVLQTEKDILFLHTRATDDIVFAANNSLFVEYFSLTETKDGNEYENHHIKFTGRQREIKSQLEKWIFHFQEKFTVDEACLIDRTGQEHLRLFRNNIEPDAKLSPHERHEPFFEPSFETPKGAAYIQPPYLSSDTGRWVFAYTTPIELTDGEKPAFFHFEMPIKVLHDLLPSDRGRMSIMDPTGHLMADTKISFPTTNIPAEFGKYFPPVKLISDAAEFKDLLRRMKMEKEGVGAYTEHGDTQHVVFKRLETFDWVLFYSVPESVIMSTGDFSVNHLKNVVIAIASLVTLIIVATTFFVANRITHPIVKLRDAVKKVSQGDLDGDITVKGDDEIHDLAQAFGSMTQSLRKKIEIERRLAITEQKLKQGKLTAMGSASARLVHDIRNLLSTIKTAVDLIKSKTNTMDEKTVEQHKRLDRAVDKMTFQVNSVMDFVRTGPLHMGDHTIAEIIDSSLGDIDVPEGIKITRPEDEVLIRCDRKALEVAMSNLITNAMQAVGSEGEINIRAGESEDKWVIEVEDSGPGIPEEILPRIFESLYTTKEEGTGLGLVSCRSIIEQHDGTINAYNNPTRFVIELPKPDGKGTQGQDY